jgi:hypothetical protein
MGVSRGSKAPRAFVVGRTSNAVDKDASRVSVLQHSAIFSSLAFSSIRGMPDRLAFVTSSCGPYAVMSA